MIAEGSTGPRDAAKGCAVIRRLLVVGAVGALAAVPVLGGGGELTHAGDASAAPAARRAVPALTRFTSCRRFLAHVRHRALAQAGPWGLDGAPVPMPLDAPGAEGGDRAAAPATAPRAGVDFSDTNVQEAGVDEPDIVKTDGRTLFALSGRRLVAVDVSGGVARPLGGLEIEGVMPSGLLLLGDRLLVVGEKGTAFAGDVPVAATSIRIGGPLADPVTVAVQLDVSNPARPRVLARMSVDGRLLSARRTGATVRLVVASTPTRLPLATPASGEATAVRIAARANRRAIARATAAAWLPRVSVRDVVAKRTVRRSVGCGAVSRPSRYAGLGMVSVLTVDASGGLTLLDTEAVLTDGGIVYASPVATYIATPRWYSPGAADAARAPRGSTLIHAFDTSDPARTTYRASGTVRGYPLNQFSLSEHEGDLRVATTEEPDWWNPPAGDPAPSESIVTVLRQSGGRLARVGEVEGLGRGERIYAVRFLGDRGYVVTFRQTDPLYALDLSDPAHPTVRGELKIPGFSSYLHPVDATTLIGIGQDADSQGRARGTQVSLFDVSDLDAPRRIAQRTLDTDWSEAESDHHAFLYWPATRLLVLPAQSYGASGRPAFLGAVGLHVARDTGITPIARVGHPGDPESTWAPVRRSVVVGDALFTVSDTGVMASDLQTLAPRGWAAFR